MKVNEFSLGMGPAILKKQGGETLYALRLIPIGGYCAMEGESEDSQDSRALNNKKGWQKCVIFVAGALMNVLLCVVLMIIVSFVNGEPTTTLEEVSAGGSAAAAGVRAGDEIVAVDGKAVSEWTEVTEAIGKAKESLVFTVRRGGDETDIEVAVEYNKEEQRNMVGITSAVRRNPAGAFAGGIMATGELTVSMYRILGMLFTGKVSTRELSGPVGIVTAVKESSRMGLIYVAYLTALISLNLAVINLLPFPALDGGRILFLAIRKITGKRVTDRVENAVNMIGMILLLVLMIYVTMNDIVRLM